MTENDILLKLRLALRIGLEMRIAQREYFKTRTKTALSEAKRFENAFDLRISELKNSGGESGMMIEDIKKALEDGRKGVDGTIETEQLAALVELFDAAKQTLEKNLHLADGDRCTLKVLRDAVKRLEGP